MALTHEIFDITFESFGFRAKESVLMVGDSLSSDILGGTNYGIDTCRFSPRARSRSATDCGSHDIRGIEELLELVGV